MSVTVMNVLNASRNSMALDLDVHNLLDDHEADEFGDGRAGEHHASQRIGEERSRELRADEAEDQQQPDRDAADHVAGQTLLRRQRADLSPDALPLAHRMSHV